MHYLPRNNFIDLITNTQLIIGYATLLFQINPRNLPTLQYTQQLSIFGNDQI